MSVGSRTSPELRARAAENLKQIYEVDLGGVKPVSSSLRAPDAGWMQFMRKRRSRFPALLTCIFCLVLLATIYGIFHTVLPNETQERVSHRPPAVC